MATSYQPGGNVYQTGAPGIGSTQAFVINGDPFLSSSNVTGNMPNNGELRIQFPRVIRAVTFVNTGGEPLMIHFASRENPAVYAYGYYVRIDNPGDAWAFPVRAKEIYVSMVNSVGTGSFSMMAELTSIDAREMYTLSGSGINT